MTRAAARGLRGVGAGAAAVLVDRDCDPLLEAALQAVREAGISGPVTVLAAPGRELPTGLAGTVRLVPVDAPTQALAALAEAAGGSARSAAEPPTSLAVLDCGLVARAVALLDVLDRPGAGTLAWVLDDASAPEVLAGADPTPVLPRVRLSPGRSRVVESVATPVHALGRPNGWLAGLLRVGGDDLAAAAAAWRAASTQPDVLDAEPGLGGVLAFALLTLTRSGLRVPATPLSGWTMGLAAGPQDAEAALASGGPTSDDWRLRLVQAKRPVDGLYSTFLVRAVSRRVTWLLLPTGIAPNTVTVFSFGLGIVAALLAWQGSWAALVGAAVVLQVSLVLDCVDGEIARYTRRYSNLGAWLDVTGDRIKEYGVFAGLAASSARNGTDIWWLALVALALVAYRHFVDYAFGAVTRVAERPRVSVLPVDVLDDGVVTGPVDGPAGATPDGGGRLAGMISATDATNRRALVHWAKKAIHLPIGERFLIVSLGMLTGSPTVALGLLVAAEVVSVLYTTPGRLLRSLSGGRRAQ